MVGRDGGFTKQKGNNVIIIPNVDKKLVTPFTEAFQAVVWHCIVSHPLLQSKKQNGNSMRFLKDLKIKIFADGADIASIKELDSNQL